MSELVGSKLCPECGTGNFTTDSYCRVCGAVLLDAVRLDVPPPLFSEMTTGIGWPDAPPLEFLGEMVPATPVNEMLQGQQTDEAQADAAAQKRCGWCSAINPATAANCEKCGAHFPVPEQDAALLRASEARMESEEIALLLMQERRIRRNFWLGLGGRWRFRL